MQIVLMILYTMLILTGLVCVHEWGHYIAAKKNGINVAEFSIGFGPRLVRWRRGGTEFSFRPILFGGYVRFQDDVEDPVPRPGDYRTAPLKARAITSVAGPAMNVVLAFVLAAIMLTIAPEFQAVRIARVEPGTPAEAAGLEEGDIIRELNGVDMSFYSMGMADYRATPHGQVIHVVADRDGQRYEADVDLGTEDPSTKMGISMESAPYSFLEACALSFKWLGQQTWEVLKALGNLFFRGQGVENMSGIVGTTVIVGNVVQYGTAGLVLMIVALISVNLAVINLLPIPALDGGKLLLYGIEAIRRRPCPERVEAIMNAIGLTVVMGLAVIMVFVDISKMVG